MRIGVIQASSQANKNSLLFCAVQKYAAGSEIVNFGCWPEEHDGYSYVEVSLLVGLLLTGGAVDFVVTGCSSGQGMMLACNSFPGVLCGYAPTPMDAWLFAQINNGNAVSLPLGEEYTWTGSENLERTIEKLFSEPFGQGYPRSEAERKRRDTEILKEIRRLSQVDPADFLNRLESQTIRKILARREVIEDILAHGHDSPVADWIARQNMQYGQTRTVEP
ncbi:MAG: RpiB/LacA/LacB family sugar-phosphate isomerase [Clostridia bacterium]|nr:RpiB/LacA/LacB family sugar-phosphate isomerase [Clostridia bacterium]